MKVNKDSKFSWKMSNIKFIKKSNKLGIPKLKELLKRQKKA